MNRLLCLLAALGVLLVRAEDSFAQVRWDEASKAFFVTVPTDSTGVEMKVVPTNRAIVTVGYSVQDSTTAVHYRYVVRVDSSSPQPLAMLRVPCARNAAVQGRFGGEWNRVSRWGGGTYCVFFLGAAVGRQVAVGFNSTLLMGMEDGFVIGAAAVPVWPTTDPTPETIALKPLVDSLAGRVPQGLVRRIRVPVPKHPRAAVADAATGLSIIASELNSICSTTDWITPATCTELFSELALATSASSGTSLRASPSTATPKTASAVLPALNTFLQTLNSERNVTIQQNAYAVLATLARVTRGG